MAGSIKRAFASSLIETYVEMGREALARGEYEIARKMYKAALEEPSSREQKHEFMGEMLSSMARAHEGLRQFYRAKLLYIRFLAHHRRGRAGTDMLVIETLCRLARLTAYQGLYRQSAEFLAQALDSANQISAALSVEITGILKDIGAVYVPKGRTAELALLDRLLARQGSVPTGTRVFVAATATTDEMRAGQR